MRWQCDASKWQRDGRSRSCDDAERRWYSVHGSLADGTSRTRTALTDKMLEMWDGPKPQRDAVYKWVTTVLKPEEVANYFEDNKIEEANQAYRAYQGKGKVKEF